ncbi:hypothetical protein niasHT_024362 [Heterodera trifolii]|uniref:Uncharacterized protein n=1 Tax=Heterodera trifolii TaxID=157864 RepID=A0ABD2JY17_9BILA
MDNISNIGTPSRDKSSKVRLRHILGRKFSAAEEWPTPQPPPMMAQLSNSPLKRDGTSRASTRFRHPATWSIESMLAMMAKSSPDCHPRGLRWMLDVSGLTEADQKKNPGAIVRALKFYAAAVKQRENDKFMYPQKSVYPVSEDDIETDEFEFASASTATNGGAIPRRSSSTPHQCNSESCGNINSGNMLEQFNATWYYDNYDTDESATVADHSQQNVTQMPNCAAAVPMLADVPGTNATTAAATKFGNTEIYDSGNLYPYKVYITNTLSFPMNVKKSFLASTGHYATRTHDSVGDECFKARCKIFEGGKRAQFLSRLDFDLGNQELYLLNNLDLLFTIYKARDSFIMQTLKANDTTRYRVRVHDVKFIYKKMAFLNNSTANASLQPEIQGAILSRGEFTKKKQNGNHIKTILEFVSHHHHHLQQ